MASKKAEIVRRCNRCNELKESNAPCVRCGCQEFRIIGPPCPKGAACPIGRQAEGGE